MPRVGAFSVGAPRSRAHHTPFTHTHKKKNKSAAEGGDTAAPPLEQEVDLHFVAFVEAGGERVFWDVWGVVAA